MVPGAMPVAEVTLAAKLLDAGGKVLDAKTFGERMPIPRTDDSAVAVAGLSAAFGKAASALTDWAIDAMTTAEAAAPPGAAPDTFPPLLPDPIPAPPTTAGTP
jgi:hypothetical protein